MGGTERAGRTTDRGPEPAPDLELERQRDLAPDSGPDVDPAPLVVGRADDPAELEADRVADRVLARLTAAASPVLGAPGPAVRRASAGTGAVVGAEGGTVGGDVARRLTAGGAGTPLPAPLRQELSEQLGADLSHVRVHPDSPAASEIGAVAYTRGSDVHFAPGAYDPSTPEGVHLLTHELTHVVQNGRGGGSAVQRRLAGTADVAERMGGRSDGKLLFGLLLSKNWDNVLSGLRSYEKDEAKLDRKPPTFYLLARANLLLKLNSVDNDLRAWQKAHAEQEVTVGGRTQKERVADHETRQRARAAEGENSGRDERTKAGRRQAVALLEPRVRDEMAALKDRPDEWLASFGFTDAVSGSLGEDKGGMNVVNKRAYLGKEGELFTGFFKAEKGFAAAGEDGHGGLQAHEAKAGIGMHDPRYGARTVAMSRLDKLLGAGVTARAEFALSKDASGQTQLGTVLEEARGKAASKTTIMPTREMAVAAGGGAVSLDDPVLQRCLNRLQLLDAIAGQLDRHAGNYHIQADEQGRVTGVTGIDLDMAFGSEMSAQRENKHGQNYRGIPEIVDAELGRAILRVSDDDLTAVLAPLLRPNEVAAARNRLHEVQAAVREAERAGRLREAADWDREAAVLPPRQREVRKFENTSDRKSYGDDLRIESLGAVQRRLAEMMPAAVRRHHTVLPPRLEDQVMELHSDALDHLLAAANSLSKGPAPKGAFVVLDKRVPEAALSRLAAVLVGLLFPKGIPDDLLLALQDLDVPALAAVLMTADPYRSFGGLGREDLAAAATSRL